MKLITATAIALMAAPAMADDVTVIMSFERLLVKEHARDIRQHHIIHRIESDIGDATEWCNRHFFGDWMEAERDRREAEGWTAQVLSCNEVSGM